MQKPVLMDAKTSLSQPPLNHWSPTFCIMDYFFVSHLSSALDSSLWDFNNIFEWPVCNSMNRKITVGIGDPNITEMCECIRPWISTTEPCLNVVNSYKCTHANAATVRAVCPAEAGVMSEPQTPVHFTSAVVTSFNLRVVRILCGRGCLTAGQDQSEIGSESVILYSALERCGEQWERKNTWVVGVLL